MLTTQPIINAYQEWLHTYTNNIPGIEHAILSSADGFCLAHTKLPEDMLGRLAALSSSLFAVSASLTKHIDGSALNHVELHTQLGYLVLIQYEYIHQAKIILLIKPTNKNAISELLKNTSSFFETHPIFPT